MYREQANSDLLLYSGLIVFLFLETVFKLVWNLKTEVTFSLLILAYSAYRAVAHRSFFLIFVVIRDMKTKRQQAKQPHTVTISFDSKMLFLDIGIVQG